MLWASELRIWSSCRHRRDIPLRLCCLPATYQEGYSPHCSADPPLSTSHSLWFLFLSHCAEITSSLDFWNWKPKQEVCCKIPSFQLATFFCLLNFGKGKETRQGKIKILIFLKNQGLQRRIQELLCQECPPCHQLIDNDSFCPPCSRNILSQICCSCVFLRPKEMLASTDLHL